MLGKKIKKMMGESVYDWARMFRYKYLTEPRFKNQKLVDIKIGNMAIKAPEKHILFELHKRQPYRDLAIGIIAHAVSEKYPDATIVDIGANIGDTAAMIASYCGNPLILIEASDYFYDILVKNSSLFPNVKRIEKVFVSNKPRVRGILRYWGGTARFEEIGDGEEEFVWQNPWRGL